MTLSICFAALLVLTASAVAAGPNSGSLTVNTVFDPAMDSPVLEATGVFTGCTSVTDVDSNIKFPVGTA